MRMVNDIIYNVWRIGEVEAYGQVRLLSIRLSVNVSSSQDHIILGC